MLGLAFLSALIYFLIGFYSKKYYNLSDEKCGKSIAGIICISLIPLIFPALMLSFSIVFSSLVNMSLIVLVYLSEGLCVLFAVGFAVLMITGMIKCAKEAKKKEVSKRPSRSNGAEVWPTVCFAELPDVSNADDIRCAMMQTRTPYCVHDTNTDDILCVVIHRVGRSAKYHGFIKCCRRTYGQKTAVAFRFSEICLQ